jgi:hypothetical protein
MATRTKALLSSSIRAEHRGTKEVLHEDQKSKDVGVEVKPRSNEQVSVVKVSNGIRIAYGFQSVGIDIGIELPILVDIHDPNEDIANGFVTAYDIIGTELTERAQEVDGLVRKLAKKYR